MNIAFASDDNYIPYLGLSIYSILKNNELDNENKYLGEIQFFIMDMNISLENKSKLIDIATKFNAKINFLDTSYVHDIIKKSLNTNVRSFSMYYRLFLPSFLPSDVEKILYLDSDIIVMKSLKVLWETDVNNYEIGGVLDAVTDYSKIEIGLSVNDPYFNSGMLLINLKKWRENKLQSKFIEFINEKGGNVYHHDQGTINKVCKLKLILHPKFNVVTPFLILNVKQIKWFYNLKGSFYSYDEINEAKLNPVLCHLTPFVTDRPWVNNNSHPLKNQYKFLLSETIWAGHSEEKDGRQLKSWIKLLYDFLPLNLFINIILLIRFLKK